MTTKEEENFRMDVESILFGGPMSKDLGTRVEWLQSIHRRVKDGLVARANDAEKARAVAQALADEITGLKVELAAMMKERDKERAHANEWLVQKHDAEKARDAALADLSQARAERDEARDTHARAYNAASIEIVQLRNERDTAISRAESAEASAAAMRTALANVLAERYRLGDFAAKSERMADFARDAIDTASDAGRALLDRHAAELAQMRATVAASEAQTVDYAGRLGAADDVIAQLREENARLRTEHPDAPTCIVCGCETVNYIYDYNDTGVMRPTCRDCVQALFGRAVAVLQDMVDLQWNSRHPNGDQRKVDNARAILADPTATAAADAYRAQQEERADGGRCARKSCSHRHHDKTGCDECECMVFVEVDARRGAK